MARIEVKVEDQGVLAAFNRLLAAGQNLAPVLKDIGEALVRSTQARFDTGTDPEGRPWKPLARGTFEGVAAGSKKNLTKKGKLSARGIKAVTSKRPLVGETGDLRDRIAWQVEGNDLIVGTPVRYGFVHQLGGKKTYTILPKNKAALAWPGGAHPVKEVVHPPLPARPFLGISADDRISILEAFNAALSDAWEE